MSQQEMQCYHEPGEGGQKGIKMGSKREYGRKKFRQERKQQLPRVDRHNKQQNQLT